MIYALMTLFISYAHFQKLTEQTAHLNFINFVLISQNLTFQKLKNQLMYFNNIIGKVVPCFFIEPHFRFGSLHIFIAPIHNSIQQKPLNLIV